MKTPNRIKTGVKIAHLNFERYENGNNYIANRTH